ncbi:DUF7507 domain-containing protein [Salisediminibacterium selenitireducens]|nr:SpaA isopeptide-forming pilin-related protein [Salisediminibacterium selenitireducens]
MDIDGDGNTQERIAHAQATFSYTAPRETVITKRVKGSLDQAFVSNPNSGLTVPDGAGAYELIVLNSSDRDLDSFSLIDALPRVGDQRLVKNNNGVLLNRNSEYPVLLDGPIEVPDEFTVYYNTDDPVGDAAVYEAQSGWTTEVSDYRSIRGFKIVLSDGNTVGTNELITIEVPIYVEDTDTLSFNDEAVNSFALSTNQGSYIESNLVRLRVRPEAANPDLTVEKSAKVMQASENGGPGAPGAPGRPSAPLSVTGFSESETSISNLSEDRYNEIGDVIEYIIRAANTGDSVLYNVGITDDKEGLFSTSYAVFNSDGESTGNTVTNGQVTLEPGQYLQMRALYSVTAEDVEAGQIINTASGEGVPGIGEPPVNDDDDAIVYGEQTPAIALEKTADRDALVVGEDVTYTFTATNTGNVTLADVVITDPLTGLSAITYLTIDDETLEDGDAITMHPGQVLVAEAAYTVTQEDLNAGSLYNLATVSGTPEDPDAPEVSDDDDHTITGEQTPAIALEKTADRDALVVGEDVTYTFTATNTGNVTLTDVVITDPLTGLSAITYLTIDDETLEDGDAITMHPGQVLVAEATYTVTQEDLNAGSLYNLATVSGTPEDPDAPEVSDDDDHTITGEQTPAIALEKTADRDALVVGEDVTYTFTATNTGNVTLTDVVITDPLTGLSAITYLTIDDETLEDGDAITMHPGQVLVAEATYTVTQEDLNAGSLYNLATVSGTPEDPDAPEVSDDDDHTITGEQTPAIALEKTADRDALVVGEDVTYTFTATNTGNVTLTDVVITDPLTGLSAITYLTIDDETLEDGDAITMHPGQVLVAEATYTVTQEDLNAGSLYNLATVSGTPEDPDAPEVSDDDDHTITGEQTPAIALEKTADRDALVVGEDVTYTFTATNTGNVTLTDVVITDPLTGLSAITYLTIDDETLEDGDAITMHPGQVLVAEAAYTVTQEDLNAGSLYNLATVSGTPEDPDAPEVSDDDDHTITGEQTPAIALEKTADRDALVVGEDVTYTFTATNTGNVTLTDVVITDPLTGLSAITYLTIDDETLEDGDAITMHPGQVLVAEAAYTVTQEDLNAGSLYNLATVSGTPEDPDAPEVSDDDDHTITGEQTPAIALEKTADRDALVVGEDVTYTFTATNTGNVTLTDVVITDPLTGLSAITYLTIDDETLEDGDAITMHPGQVLVAEAAYTVTQEDLNAGSLYNLATVSGTPEDPDAPEVSDDDDHTITGEQTPAIALEKTADRDALVVGEDVTYTFTATNTGNVTLTDVVITDPLTGLSAITYLTIDDETLEDGDAITMHPGQVLVAEATYTVTQEDLNAGSLYNLATVSGTPEDPDAPEVSDDDDHTITGEQTPAIALEKTADRDALVVGEDVTYTFTATNTGNVTLTDVVITDPLTGLSAITYLTIDDETLEDGDAITMHPGQVLVAEAAYTVTQEDLNAGSLYNLATVSGTPEDPDAPEVSDDDDHTITGEQTPAIALEKTADRDALVVGEDVTYTFTATNTGNVTLTDVVITDPLTGLSAITYLTIDDETLEDGDAITMHPGQVLVAEAAYTVTQEDLNAGSLYNLATVSGTPEDPDAPEVSDDDDHTIGVIESNANVALTKVNEEGDRLEGAVFELRNEDGEVISSAHSTDENGQVFIYGLSDGEYSFVETKAPEGYILDETPIVFTVNTLQETLIELDVLNVREVEESTEVPETTDPVNPPESGSTTPPSNEGTDENPETEVIETPGIDETLENESSGTPEVAEEEKQSSEEDREQEVMSGSPPSAQTLPQTGSTYSWLMVITGLMLLMIGGMMVQQNGRFKKEK